MKTLEFGSGIVKNIPETIAEMTPADRLFTMALYDVLEQGKMSVSEFTLRVLCRLISFKPRSSYFFMRRYSKDSLERVTSNLALLCNDLFTTLFDVNSDGCMIRFDSLENPFPVLRNRGKLLVGPGILLSDISFSQFRYATTRLGVFTRTKDPLELDNLIAALWLPKGVRFSATSPFPHLSDLRRLKRWKKNTILLWFCSCIKHIQHSDIDVDGEIINLSSIFSGGSSGGDSLGWTSILFDLSAEKVFGDIEATDNASLFDVLVFLYHNYLKIKRYESA